MTPNTKTAIPNPAANHFQCEILNHPPLRSALSDLNLANVLAANHAGAFGGGTEAKSPSNSLPNPSFPCSFLLFIFD
jgi:hypothetical protein